MIIRHSLHIGDRSIAWAVSSWLIARQMKTAAYWVLVSGAQWNCCELMLAPYYLTLSPSLISWKHKTWWICYLWGNAGLNDWINGTHTHSHTQPCVANKQNCIVSNCSSWTQNQSTPTTETISCEIVVHSLLQRKIKCIFNNIQQAIWTPFIVIVHSTTATDSSLAIKLVK